VADFDDDLADDHGGGRGYLDAELINRALAPYPADLVITTKVWPGRDPSGEWVWASPAQLRGQVEENLCQLGRDYLDVVNLRMPRSQETASIAEHFGALSALRDSGLIRHLGISNVRPKHLAEARAIAPVVCVQNSYGIGASADKRDFVRACGEQGVAFVPFFAIAGRTCWPSRARETRITWPPTWPLARCGSPRTRWPASTLPLLSSGQQPPGTTVLSDA